MDTDTRRCALSGQHGVNARKRSAPPEGVRERVEMRLNLARGVVRAVLATVWLLILVVSCAPVTPTVTPANGVVQPDNVRITFGRAVLDTDGRVTLFYVAKHISGSSEGGTFIDGAEITSSDTRSWPADGYGRLIDRPPLALGWLTFPVSKGAKGNLHVTVNSVQTGGGSTAVSWQMEQIDGLVAPVDMSEPIIVDSDICVSSDSVAFGFHEKACDTEFVDPHTIRERGSTPKATSVTPRPRPTPSESSIRTPPIPVPWSKPSPGTEDTLLFTLCTPWHFQILVIIDNVETPELGESAPTTSSRCLLP